MFDDIALPIIRQKLIDALNFADNEIVLHIDEKVLAPRGRRQINIFPSLLIPGGSFDQHVGQEYMCGFNIGITRRTGDIPNQAQWEKGYVSEMLVMLRGILTTIRKDRWTIVEEINTAIGLEEVLDPWKLVEAYRHSGDTAAVTRVGPDHFNADEVTDRPDRDTYGLWLQIGYDSARYMSSGHPDQVMAVR